MFSYDSLAKWAFDAIAKLPILIMAALVFAVFIAAGFVLGHLLAVFFLTGG